MNLDKIKFSPCILDKASASNVLPVGDDLPDAFLADTPWHGKGPTVFVGSLIPNLFFIYFGQDVPEGNITEEKTRLAIGDLGTGYETWINYQVKIVKHLIPIDMVVHKISQDAAYDPDTYVKTYFDPTYDSSTDIQVNSKGSYLVILSVSSTRYPAEAAQIKKKFVSSVGISSLAGLVA